MARKRWVSVSRINASLAGLSSPPTSAGSTQGKVRNCPAWKNCGHSRRAGVRAASRAGEEPKILTLPSLVVERNVLLTSSCGRARCCCCHQLAPTSNARHSCSSRALGAPNLLQGSSRVSYSHQKGSKVNRNWFFFVPLKDVGGAWPLLWKSFRRWKLLVPAQLDLEDFPLGEMHFAFDRDAFCQSFPISQVEILIQNLSARTLNVWSIIPISRRIFAYPILLPLLLDAFVPELLPWFVIL